MTITRRVLSACALTACWFVVETGLAEPAVAAPAVARVAAPAALGSAVLPVQYRGRGFYGRPAYRPYAYRPYYRPYYGYGYGLPLVAGVATTVIAAEAIRENRARSSDYERCAAAFRSFNPRTGTYVTYGGDVRVCPYLE
jgi:hypothetical protein